MTSFKIEDTYGLNAPIRSDTSLNTVVSSIKRFAFDLVTFLYPLLVVQKGILDSTERM